MSYILDALRKAEAERQRGQVPGVLAPMAPPPPAPAPVGRRWAVPLAAGLLALLLVVAGALYWRAQASAPQAGAAAAGPPVASAGAPVQPQSQPQSQPQAQPQLPLVVSAPTPVQAAPAAVAPAVPAASVVQAGSPAPQAAPGAVTASPAAAPRPAPAPAVPAAIKLADLPPDQRAAFPPLALGGSVWSDVPSARFVMVGGQVLREGDAPAPGLVIERLWPKAMWLRWRGQLVEVPL